MILKLPWTCSSASAMISAALICRSIIRPWLISKVLPKLCAIADASSFASIVSAPRLAFIALSLSRTVLRRRSALTRLATCSKLHAIFLLKARAATSLTIRTALVAWVLTVLNTIGDIERN
jgi:hypothetical protein